MSNKKTFELIKNWFLEIKSYVENIRTVLVGNKCDLVDLEVTVEEAKALASEFKATYLSVSAKEDRNISEIFSTLAIGKNIFILIII
jgi:GTPase SAR1 family protein